MRATLYAIGIAVALLLLVVQPAHAQSATTAVYYGAPETRNVPGVGPVVVRISIGLRHGSEPGFPERHWRVSPYLANLRVPANLRGSYNASCELYGDPKMIQTVWAQVSTVHQHWQYQSFWLPDKWIEVPISSGRKQLGPFSNWNLLGNGFSDAPVFEGKYLARIRLFNNAGMQVDAWEVEIKTFP
jgi:hypothetical protein